MTRIIPKRKSLSMEIPGQSNQSHSAGEKEMPEIPRKKDKRRGRIAKSDAHNLWERLSKFAKSVLLFAQLPHVPFTNNRAEQDLRMAKVKQKVSGFFRTLEYAQVYCRISSYLQTMKYRGVNPLIAIYMGLIGDITEQSNQHAYHARLKLCGKWV
jgi:transposase